MPGTYTRSNGKTVQIDDLDFHHCKSAADKLERMDPDRTEEIKNLRARQEALTEQWKRDHPEEA